MLAHFTLPIQAGILYKVNISRVRKLMMQTLALRSQLMKGDLRVERAKVVKERGGCSQLVALRSGEYWKSTTQRTWVSHFVTFKLQTMTTVQPSALRNMITGRFLRGGWSEGATWFQGLWQNQIEKLCNSALQYCANRSRYLRHSSKPRTSSKRFSRD